MKINEVVDESIETKAGLTKDQKDAIGGRGKYKPKAPAPKTQKQHQQHVQFKPAQYRDPLNLGKHKGAMNRTASR
tara:strand:- start:1254 stop:1478 length:225 start_codon:yes stop_codon:yes gene_type:complete